MTRTCFHPWGQEAENPRNPDKSRIYRGLHGNRFHPVEWFATGLLSNPNRVITVYVILMYLHLKMMKKVNI